MLASRLAGPDGAVPSLPGSDSWLSKKKQKIRSLFKSCASWWRSSYILHVVRIWSSTNTYLLHVGLATWLFDRVTCAISRRSRASVSKVISQPRSLGRRPVDRAAGAALRLIDFTHVRVYSRATHDDFFSAFFDPTKGRRLAFACFPFFFDHFD